MHRRHAIGKRRTALVAGAVYCLSRAVAYIPTIRRTPIQEPIYAAAAGREWMLWCWVALWAAAGGYCLYSMRRARLIYPMCAVAFLAGAWGTAWLIGWIQHPDTDWWQTALTYWCPAIAILALTALTPHLPPQEEAPRA